MPEALPFREYIAPDPILAQKWNSLLGLDEVKQRILFSFKTAMNPNILYDWFVQVYQKDAPKNLFASLDAKGKVLISGPSGTGKSEFVFGLANALSETFQKPTHFLVADLVRSKFEGESARYIWQTFQYARQKAVETKEIFLVFYDEGDSVAGDRTNEQMHDTVKQAVNRFLQELEMTDPKQGVFVAVCSNLRQIIDAACDRRFDIHENFELPDESLRYEFLSRFLQDFNISDKFTRKLAKQTHGNNYGQLKHLVLNSVRGAARENRKLTEKDLTETLRKMMELREKSGKGASRRKV